MKGRESSQRPLSISGESRPSPPVLKDDEGKLLRGVGAVVHRQMLVVGQVGAGGAEVPGRLLRELARIDADDPYHFNRRQSGAVRHVVADQVVAHRIHVYRSRNHDLARNVAVVGIAGGGACIDVRDAHRLADDPGAEQRDDRLVRVAGIDRRVRHTRIVLRQRGGSRGRRGRVRV